MHIPARESRIEPNEAPVSEPESAGTIVVLNRDVFFAVKIGNTLRSLGYAVVFAKTTAELAGCMDDSERTPNLAVIDINAGIDWDRLATLTGGAVPFLAFGSHLDVEGLRAAKAAGVTRVVSNGDFHRDMVALVKRYATNSSS